MPVIKTYHIHLSGIVQGVGMRPYVLQTAIQLNLNGWINNANDGVHIEFNATEVQAEKFLETLLTSHPPFAVIRSYKLTEIKSQDFKSFEILNSDISKEPDLLLTPDFAICSDCKTELYSSSSRRYQYPFITCTNCGPRYSITKKLPFDRLNTAMETFSMCEECNNEYNSTLDRRFYSQTNSCPNCSIKMHLYKNGEKLKNINQEKILEEVRQQLESGKIVALKGVGGYVLLCDATNSASIQTLRKRKNRIAKPFALLFKNIDDIKSYAEINESERKCLQSFVAPILLLKCIDSSKLPLNDIAPRLSHIGCMLPNSPLLDLLSSIFRKPLVCTSANISDSPILFRDEDALLYLKNIADIILVHNREIITAQDDSVIKFTKYSNQKIIIRRARGLAPNYLEYEQRQNESILATGALMKSSFTLQSKNKTFISQYLGSTHTIEAEEIFKYSLKNLVSILQFQPKQIVSDKHPDYFSTHFAKEISISNNIPLNQVQHHRAHFAAVLAEHSLLDTEEPILGVIWDGAGLGDDQQIWGSEFFKYERHSMLRCYHFDYFQQLLNDKMSREPRLTLMSICNDVIGSDDFVKGKFTDTEWAYYKKLLQNNEQIQCCSMGRIFDGIASLLSLSDKQSYEGESALLLQTLAEEYTNENGYNFTESYFLDGAHYNRISTSSLFSSILRDILKNKSNSFIAAKFHFSLVHLISIIARNIGVKKIAFSGGVFQNSLLVDMIQIGLKKNFQLYFHKQLSPNDENISFGQMVYFDRQVDMTVIENNGMHQKSGTNQRLFKV